MLALFDDPYLERLAPFSKTHPPAQLRIGAWSLLELLQEIRPLAPWVVSENPLRLAAHGTPAAPQLPRSPAVVWCLNARLLPHPEELATLLDRMEGEKSIALWAECPEEQLIAFKGKGLPAESNNFSPAFSHQALLAFAKQAAIQEKVTAALLLSSAHQLVAQNKILLPLHLKLKRQCGQVSLHRSAPERFPQVFFDETQGEIFLERGVQVSPFSVLKGPLWVGGGSMVSPHAYLRSSSLGKKGRFGGEISDSLVLDYTNKGHYGFLGNSVVGEWVNLGAGTTTSNLKNTYGEIRLAPLTRQAAPTPTGQQFFGALIASHAKLAIQSSLATGRRIGVGASVRGRIDEDVDDFIFQTSRSQSLWKFDSFIKAQTRMAERRQVRMLPAWKQLMQALFKAAHPQAPH